MDVPGDAVRFSPHIAVTPAMRDTLALGVHMRRLGVCDGGGFIPRLPDEPPAFFAHMQSEGVGAAGGAHATDPARALTAALAESLERRLWVNSAHLYARSISSSEDALRRPHLPLSKFAGYEHGKSAVRESFQNVPLRWIRGASLTSRIPLPQWTPLQTVAATAKEYRSEREPLLRGRTTNGIAAGRTRTDAVLHGLLELIERDAFSIAFAHRLSPPTIALESFAASSETRGALVRSCKRLQLDVVFTLAPTDFPVHVVVATILDRTGRGPALTIGASAKCDAGDAAEAAFLEALASRYFLRITTPQDEGASTRALRARLAQWAQEEHARRFSFFTSGTPIPLPTPFLYGTSASRKLTTLKKTLRASGYHGCVVDIKKGSVFEALPLHVVAVVVPELHPIQLDEGPAYTYGERLYTLPKKLGYAPAEVLNTEPNPFP